VPSLSTAGDFTTSLFLFFIVLLIDRQRKLRATKLYSKLYGTTTNLISTPISQDDDSKAGRFDWSRVSPRYSVKSTTPLPRRVDNKLPIIQATMKEETAVERKTRLRRLEAVKSNFTNAWQGYKAHAWLRDEVMPISGQAQDPFGGWAATLVDALGIVLSYLTLKEFVNLWKRYLVYHGAQ
jgi:hypothetical protein